MASKKRYYKILAINWQDISNPLGGGAEVHFHEIFKRVAAAGHNVTLLCSRYNGAADEEMIDGIRIVRRGKRNTFNFVVPSEYKKLRDEKEFDVVIDDINKIPFYTPLYVKEPILAIVHHFFSRTIYLEVPFLQASYVYLSEKLVPFIYRNTPFAAVSESSRQELIDAGIRAPVHLLPNGVNVSEYRLRPELKSSTPLIGYLGRLKKYKSVDHLLRALPLVVRAVPDTRLLIIGDGDDRHRLEKLAGQLGIADKVEFAGQVDHETKIDLLNRVWCVVNPSPKEGWGLTVIEANACGAPVIAANSPGLRDSVVDGKTGRLYSYGNVEQLAQHLIGLLKDEKERNYFSQQSRLWSEKFSWEASAEKAIAIIETVLDAKS